MSFLRAHKLLCDLHVRDHNVAGFFWLCVAQSLNQLQLMLTSLVPKLDVWRIIKPAIESQIRQNPRHEPNDKAKQTVSGEI